MSENTEKTAVTEEIAITENRAVEKILENLTVLQSRMTDMSVSPSVTANSIVATVEAMAEGSIEGNLGDIVSDITGMFAMREENYRNLIALYDRMLALISEERKAKQSAVGRLEAVANFAKTLNCDEFDGQVWDMLMASLQTELQYKDP